MPGMMGWLLGDKVQETAEMLAVQISGENLRACEDVFRSYKAEGKIEKFLGKKLTKSIITALMTYKKTIISYPGEMAVYIRHSKKYIDHTVSYLKKYDKELEIFKNTDATFKNLESAKKKMLEIVKLLHSKTTEFQSYKYTAAAVKESVSKSSRVEITPYLLGDFANDFSKVLTYSFENFEKVINLSDHPAINYKQLEIKDVTKSFWKKKIDREKSVKADITNKYKKDAEAAKKKVDAYLKEATKIHNKIKVFYEKAVADKGKIKSFVGANDKDLERAEWKLGGFYNYCVEICQLTGLACCGHAGSPAEPTEGNAGIIKLAEQIVANIKGENYSQALANAKTAEENIKKIKELNKASQKPMKEIQTLLKKAAKAKVV